MTIDRDLIQRLTERLDHLHSNYDLPCQSALIAEALDYLDQPEPEGPTVEGRELQWPPSVALGCHEAAAEAEPGSPLQQLLVAAGDLLESRCGRPAVESVPDTKARELLNLLLDDLDALIDSSEGVAGLHLNGDIACWESLRQGGRFETWLMRMDEARAFLDSTMDKPAGARPAIEPVPVSERSWEREGWCDSDGWCWCFDADGTDPCWSFSHPEAWVCWTHVLPHYALPVPAATEKP